MFRRKVNDGYGTKINSGGTVSWQNKTEGNPRVKVFRDSILSTKVRNSPTSLYEQVIMPDVEDDEEIDEDNPEEVEFYEMQLQNEWVAENLVDYYQELNMMYNIFLMQNDDWTEALKHPERLPNNGFPPNMKYLWKKIPESPPQEVRVDEYMSLVLEWIEEQVLSEDIFPTDGEVYFKIDFIPRYAKKIFQRMLRVFAILLVNPDLSGVNTEYTNEQTKTFLRLFQRFIVFALHWNLVPNREVKCISEFVDPIMQRFQRAKKEYMKQNQ